MWHTKHNFSFEVATAVQTLKGVTFFTWFDFFISSCWYICSVVQFRICIFLEFRTSKLTFYAWLTKFGRQLWTLVTAWGRSNKHLSHHLSQITYHLSYHNTFHNRLREIQQTLIPSILHFVQCALSTLCVSVNTFLKRSIQKLGTTYHINRLRQIQQTLILSIVFYREPYHIRVYTFIFQACTGIPLPFSICKKFNRVEADSTNTYPINSEHVVWQWTLFIKQVFQS